MRLLAATAAVLLAAAGAAPAADTRGPVVSLRAVRAKLDRLGTIAIAVVCPIAEREPCAGELRVARGGQELGLAGFDTEPGSRQVVRVVLTDAAVALVGRRMGLRAAVTATATDAAGNQGVRTIGVFLRPHAARKHP